MLSISVLQNKLIENFQVDYIGIINKHGRLEDSVYKQDIPLDANKKEMFCMCVRLQNSMQCDFDDEFGPINYAVIERERSKFVSIPVTSYTILVIMNRDMDHIEVIEEIMKIGNRFRSQKVGKLATSA
ncbi:MAG: hypothetical protein QW177_06980 [Candidatus Nitrosotenuis sp.]